MKPRPIVPAKPQQTETNKNGNSVSWHEWTQQLQAYIAWVNSQLRKRPELKSVQDLRTDLQSGEVLAQLIEIICKYSLSGKCLSSFLNDYGSRSCYSAGDDSVRLP